MHLHNFLKSLREQVQTALRHFLAHSLCSLFSVDKCQQAVESQRKRLIVRPRGILGFNLSCVCLSLSRVSLTCANYEEETSAEAANRRKRKV